MTRPLEITGLTKAFGSFVAIRNFGAKIEAGEFVCILGHSGCGKSTILSIMAGLQRATLGGVLIDGKEVTTPGADRAVVFQSPSLLPWLSARGNVALAVENTPARSTRRKRQAIADHYLELVGTVDAAAQMPAQLSLGTQQ